MGAVPLRGELIVAFDLARFRAGVGGYPLGHAEPLFDLLAQQPGARLPSDPRYAARARTTAHGCAVPSALLAELDDPRGGGLTSDGGARPTSARPLPLLGDVGRQGRDSVTHAVASS